MCVYNYIDILTPHHEMEKKKKHKTAGHAFQVNAIEMKTNNKYTHSHKNSQYQNSKVTKTLTGTKK